MPQYTFECQNCGRYDVWKSMSDDLSKDKCTRCQEDALRVFTIFNVGKMDSTLVRKIDEGMTPKVVKKEDLPKSNIRKKEKNPRPWMV